MERPPESLKSLASRIAQVATSEDGRQMTRLLRVSGLLGQPLKPAVGQSLTGRPGNLDNKDRALSPNSDCVGIWERKSENGKTYFARRMDKIQEWQYWANVVQIPPKSAKRRILLLGESVARGYLYDPQFTPAMALEEILQSQFGKSGVEVIDLARTNMGLEVRELARSALSLEPDAVVIFSGNNWGASFPPDVSKIPDIDAALRDQGVLGLKQYVEAELGCEVRRVVKDIASLYESKNVPVVWIIPEFNLLDWREPLTNAPHLTDGLNQEWVSHRLAAESALEDEDFGRASALAQKMVEIDQGVSATGLYILAQCSLRLNDLDAARRYLELARDAVIWDSSRSFTPRVYSVTQDTLRDEAGKYKNEIVDLPKVFKEYLKGGIPGRRLFLDYCHLTSEGIQIAMAVAARSVLRSLNGSDLPWEALSQKCISPTRGEEAEAFFLAALHNAHWWQSYDVVHHYCRRSVQLSPRIAQVMTPYMDIQNRRTTPMLMCKSAEQIAELGSPLMLRYLLRYSSQQLDTILLSAIVDSLKMVAKDARLRLEQLRREEHSITCGETNLLSYYYCSDAIQPQEAAWTMPVLEGSVRRKMANHYKAYWLESRFVFVGEEGRSVRLGLTCRLPDPGPSEGTIFIMVNGKRQAEIVISREWGTWDILVPGAVVRDGPNAIVIGWPMPKFASQRALDAVMDDLVKNRILELYSVFGEIDSFTVSDGQGI
jgi:hypothetical protein